MTVPVGNEVVFSNAEDVDEYISFGVLSSLVYDSEVLSSLVYNSEVLNSEDNKCMAVSSNVGITEMMLF